MSSIYKMDLVGTFNKGPLLAVHLVSLLSTQVGNLFILYMMNTKMFNMGTGIVVFNIS